MSFFISVTQALRETRASPAVLELLVPLVNVVRVVPVESKEHPGLLVNT